MGNNEINETNELVSRKDESEKDFLEKAFYTFPDVALEEDLQDAADEAGVRVDDISITLETNENYNRNTVARYLELDKELSDDEFESGYSSVSSLDHLESVIEKMAEEKLVRVGSRAELQCMSAESIFFVYLGITIQLNATSSQ